jgi:hypothetical protein
MLRREASTIMNKVRKKRIIKHLKWMIGDIDYKNRIDNAYGDGKLLLSQGAE